MKKRLSLVLVLALILGAFAGCGGGAAEDQKEMVLNWNIGADPKTIDPQLSAAVDSAHIINNTFEGLMREDASGMLQPAMAESYDISDDLLTYTFHLRDAKWSDGEPVKAADFVYAWKRGCDPNLIPEPAEYSYMFYYIAGAQAANEGTGSLDDIVVSAPDDKTLVVELVAPTPYFPDLTALNMYFPVRQDIVEQDPAAWARTPELAVSNGPFKLAAYTAGDRLELVPNENYWNADSVKLTKIVGLMVVDATTMLSAYQAGEMDIIDDAPTPEIPKLKAEDPTFKILPQVGTYYYSFNNQREPFTDVKVRQALSYAIDRTAIVEKVTQGGQMEATGFVPPGLVDNTGKEFRTVNGDFGVAISTENVEKAKQLLAEAGYPDGKGFPAVEILYNTSEGHKAIAEAIQQMWKENLGIDVTLKNEEWAIFQETRQNGDYDIARGGWLGDYADPMTMLDLFISNSALNDPDYMNPAFDALIEKAKVTSGDERFKAMYDAETMMMDDMAVMPIYYYTNLLSVQDYVKNWEITKMSVFYFGNATIEKAE